MVENIPSFVAFENVFEAQTVEMLGGFPTPIGGFFFLSHDSDSTIVLSHDVSAERLKAALQTLSSISRVDANR